MNLLSNVSLSLYQFAVENVPDLDLQISLISSVALGALGVGAFLYVTCSRNTQVKELVLSNNRLTIAPDLSNNLQLKHLDLSHNRLTALHESILSLSSECEVNVTNNQFTPEYIAGFMAHLEQHRALYPGQGPRVQFSVYDYHETQNISLEEQLNAWSEKFATEFPLDNSPRPDKSQLQPNDEEEEQLAVFLKRLPELKDYSLGGETRKNVILRVENMLQLSCKNLEFRNAMFLVLNQATETCRDRVLLCFNDIEILYQFHSKKLTDDEFKELALSEGRYEVLRKDALEIYDQNGGDDVEIILAYHVDLRENLKLPISTKYMNYRQLAGVTDEMLSQAKTKVEALSDIETLAYSPQWLAKMRKLHPDKVEEISEEFEHLVELARRYFFLNNAQRVHFLQGKDKLADLIKKAPIHNYSTVAKVIADARDKEIANLGLQQH